MYEKETIQFYYNLLQEVKTQYKQNPLGYKSRLRRVTKLYHRKKKELAANVE